MRVQLDIHIDDFIVPECEINRHDTIKHQNMTSNLNLSFYQQLNS